MSTQTKQIDICLVYLLRYFYTAVAAAMSLQSCPTLRPHRRQPTRLPRPWDSPSKNTGVGCHFLLQCMKVKNESEITQLCPTRSDPMDCSLPGSSVHGIFQARVLEWGAIAFSDFYTKIKNNGKKNSSEFLLICRYALTELTHIAGLLTGSQKCRGSCLGTKYK